MAMSLFCRHLFSLYSCRLLALCLALGSAPVIAQDAAPTSTLPASLPKGVRLLEIKGAIGPPLVQKMREALREAEPERIPAGVIVLLDSGGGDGLAAMELGRMIRAAKAHVFVVGRCFSACVNLLAAGVVRGVAHDGAVGIHRGRLTAFVKGIGVVDINPGSNPKAAATLEAGNRLMQEYFKEMGMPDALFEAMMAVPSDQKRYLDQAELAALGLVGFDPAYRGARMQAAAKLGIDVEEFESRTGAVLDKCLNGEPPSGTFVRCYRQLLATGR
jgi:hypothetical protein